LCGKPGHQVQEQVLVSEEVHVLIGGDFGRSQHNQPRLFGLDCDAQRQRSFLVDA
jgi:hypothetical protein